MKSAPDESTLRPHPILQDYYANETQRRKTVDDLFDTTASNYNAITDIMSFGSGRWYRKQALLRAGCQQGQSILDVGTGTGVIAHLAQQIVGPDGTVMALDPSIGMLGEARSLGVSHSIQGLGETLPFADNSFDLLTMGYALRHVADLHVAFHEYCRVLKPGGKVVLLEISRPQTSLATFFLKLYMKGIVPNIARIGLGSADTKKLMQYYWDTIEACVAPAQIVDALSAVGFESANRHLVMGIFSEYTAIKGVANG